MKAHHDLTHFRDFQVYAPKNFIKEVDVQVSAVIAKNPNTLHETIPICLVDKYYHRESVSFLHTFILYNHRMSKETMASMNKHPGCRLCAY